MPSQSHGTSRDCRILYVERHHVTRELLTRLLEQTGYHVYAVTNCREAINIATITECDLAICELRLSDGSGIDLLPALSNIRPIRGIALTGCGLDSDFEATQRAGFMKHLVKPVAFDTVCEAIEEVMALPANAEQTRRRPFPTPARNKGRA